MSIIINSTNCNNNCVICYDNETCEFSSVAKSPYSYPEYSGYTGYGYDKGENK